jgi:ribosomal protein L11 methyltransferase
MKYYEVDFTVIPYTQESTDVLSAMVADCGFEAFQDTANGIRGWVQQLQFHQEELDTVIAAFPIEGIRITYTVTEAAYENWNAQWEEEGFQPIILNASQASGKVSECLVCIHDTRHEEVPQARFDIKINPCQAFGTGSHQTTRLILRQLLETDLAGKYVIDAGTGTGILAIMCSKLGAQAVFAYDIDEWSVRNATYNLQLNNIYNVRICEGNSAVLTSEYPSSCQPADLLIANINRNILIADMPRFSSSLRPGGQMLLSGFYNSDADILIQQATRLDLSLQKTCSDSDWTMLLFRKKE